MDQVPACCKAPLFRRTFRMAPNLLAVLDPEMIDDAIDLRQHALQRLQRILESWALGRMVCHRRVNLLNVVSYGRNRRSVALVRPPNAERSCARKRLQATSTRGGNAVFVLSAFRSKPIERRLGVPCSPLGVPQR